VQLTGDTRLIVRNYYLLAGLYTLSASVIGGVNTLFLLSAGLSLNEVFIANAAFSAGTVLFEIPTGVVADTVGRRVSFLLSTAVLAATTLLYLYMSSIEAGVAAFAVVSVFMGLGFTFYSGATEAWLVDALNDAGYDGGLDHVFARGQMISGSAMLIGTVGGGVIGSFSLAWPFVLRAVLLMILFVVAWVVMHDRGFVPKKLTVGAIPQEVSTVARTGVRFGWRNVALRRLTLGGMVQNAVFIWVWYAWQPYFLELLGRDAVWVAGIVSALVALSTIVGNLLVEWFTRYCGKRTTMLIAAACVQAVAAIGIGLAGSFWLALVMLLLVTGALGVSMPVRQSFFHNVVPSEHRATVISFDSMISGVGGVAGQLGLGRSAEQRGIGETYVISGVLLMIAVPFLYGARRADSDGDRFEGSKPDVEGTCAAVGLPVISTVDWGVPADELL
jgi:MFS family permease